MTRSDDGGVLHFLIQELKLKSIRGSATLLRALRARTVKHDIKL